jgi:hypothetical protein
MRPTTHRLELFINLPGQGRQRALALASITPAELVDAVLQEFRGELEYLSDSVADYRLVRAADHAPLDDGAPLAAQVRDGDDLALEERPREVPQGARPLSKPVYLREQATGMVFRLAWLPAIIGRPDDNLPDNEMLAVNLAPLVSGARVSRRHAQIVEDGGQLFVESLARQNPTIVRAAAGNETRVEDGRVPLSDGDVIYLERSKLALKVIVRE